MLLARVIINNCIFASSTTSFIPVSPGGACITTLSSPPCVLMATLLPQWRWLEVPRAGRRRPAKRSERCERVKQAILDSQDLVS